MANGHRRERVFRAEIPLPRTDNDGVPFARTDIAWFEAGLRKIGSGFRKYEEARGVWEGEETTYEEAVAVYVVTFPASRLRHLKALANEASSVFRQEAILVEVSEVNAMLLAGNGNRTGSIR